MKLSKRLETCLEYTRGFVKLADIGTDHAMLPIVSILRGNVLKALAIDNKYGPFLQARTNVRKYRVTEQIDVLLGSGLDKVDDETDVVVISGMGGDNIATILAEGNRRNVKRFILQPNKNVPSVRKILKTIDYHIVDELVFEDQKKLYEVIVIEPSYQPLTSIEIEFGPINLIQKPYYFIQKAKRELDALTEALKDVTSSKEREKLEKRITLLQEVIR